MKNYILFVSLAILFLCWSCTIVHPGIIYSGTSQHLEGRQPGGQLTSAKVLKSGESCSSSSWFYIFLFYYGSGGSIEEAKLNGKITNIAVIDRKSQQILGPLYYKECVVVWGE